MAEPAQRFKTGRPSRGIDARTPRPHLLRMSAARNALALFVALAAQALAGALPARAEEPAIIAREGERFSLTPAEGGFLRLDKETGAVSYCSVKDGVSVCRLGADERAAMAAEIEKLRAENARLKAQADLGPGRPSTVPSEQEFDRALSFTERFLRRIMRIFREEAPNGGAL